MLNHAVDYSILSQTSRQILVRNIQKTGNISQRLLLEGLLLSKLFCRVETLRVKIVDVIAYPSPLLLLSDVLSVLVRFRPSHRNLQQTAVHWPRFHDRLQGGVFSEQETQVDSSLLEVFFFPDYL